MATTPLQYFSEVKTELSKVVWPTRAEVIRLTIVVLGLSILVGLFIGGLDIVFTKVIEFIISR